MKRPSLRGTLLLTAVLALAPATRADEPIERIAFGSCARQDRPQPIWYAIVEQQPQLFLFIGDNIYGDTEDMTVMCDKYAQLAGKPGFSMLRERCTLLATWDDHDYGVNDGGADYPQREASQQAFLDFFDEPAESLRRRTPGIYNARTFGPDGQRVQIILLDTRYFRSPLEKADWDPPGTGTGGPYVPLDDPAATLLGDAQWTWLREQLSAPADLRIIASSIQVIAEQHRFEKWANLPRERQRLFDLIRETKAGGVVFVSGDRHHAELSAYTPPGGYPLHDLTSSALNQDIGWYNERNRHRLGSVYRDPNFGLITIDWSADAPAIRLQIRKQDGTLAILHEIPLASLSF